MQFFLQITNRAKVGEADLKFCRCTFCKIFVLSSRTGRSNYETDRDRNEKTRSISTCDLKDLVGPPIPDDDAMMLIAMAKRIHDHDHNLKTHKPDPTHETKPSSSLIVINVSREPSTGRISAHVGVH